jgi:lysyl-tRNA synthetase class 1
MRWFALSVDYEMSGKDLIPSVELSTKIVRLLGGTPPETFIFELFLDEQGQKISKSKGNGLSVDEWLAYGPEESLALFMFGKPHAAKKLYFDVIPKAVDEYLTFLEKYPKETPEQQLENPSWHIHGGKPPAKSSPVSFAMLLNLVSAANASTKEVLWGFIRREAPDATPATDPLLDHLVGYALNYYADFVKPAKVYRAPNELERMALEDLAGRLERWDGPTDAESLQTMVFAVEQSTSSSRCAPGSPRSTKSCSARARARASAASLPSMA